MSTDPLVGTWRLVSFEVRDAEGRVTYPLGRDAAGFITYTPDGHMAVPFGRTGRAHLAEGDWGPRQMPRSRRRPATTSRTAAPTSSVAARSCTGWS